MAREASNRWRVDFVSENTRGKHSASTGLEPTGTHPGSPGPTLPPLPSAPLPQASNRRQRGQRNSHQRPQTHGKEIRALGTLLPGGSEASPPAWLLSSVRVWGVLPPASSYVKCQTAGGQPSAKLAKWPPSGPCVRTHELGEAAAKNSLSVSSVRVTAKL